MQQLEIIQLFFRQSPMTVLEIGPGHGDHTDALIDLGHFVTAIEPREEAEVFNRNKITVSSEVVRKDVFKHLPRVRKWDVAMALGVTWRTHSPYYLFDLMMDHSNHILIDNPLDSFGTWYDQKYSISGACVRLSVLQVEKYMEYKGWKKGWAMNSVSKSYENNILTSYYYKNGVDRLVSSLDNPGV